MSEIFLKDDAISLLDNRFIVIIGDSIQRGVYKDLVLLLQRNRYLTDRDLRAKGEFSFSGDKLIEGGQYGEMTNGVRYREVRQYQTEFHLVRFYFITRCYNGYMESILKDLSEDPRPDVLIINSCLWDISRYGLSSVEQYKKNLETLFKRFSETLPKTCLTIWNMTLPISKKARGGVLIPEVEHLNVSLRLDILEANFYVHKLALEYGFNTLDLHYYLRHQLQRRAGDGVHWDMTAHRRMTNLLLSFIGEAWRVKPPDHARRVLLQEQSLRETSNRPKHFNSNFSFGLNNVPQGQMSHAMGKGNNMNNIMNNNNLPPGQFSNNMMNNRNLNQGGGFEHRTTLLQRPVHENPRENVNMRNEMEYGNQQNNAMGSQCTGYGRMPDNANFGNVDFSNMQIPENMEMLNQPYENQNFSPGLRGRDEYWHQPDQIRGLPYNRYSHAY